MLMKTLMMELIFSIKIIHVAFSPFHRQYYTLQSFYFRETNRSKLAEGYKYSGLKHGLQRDRDAFSEQH